jgi:hypothetical protein
MPNNLANCAGNSRRRFPSEGGTAKYQADGEEQSKEGKYCISRTLPQVNPAQRKVRPRYPSELHRPHLPFFPSFLSYFVLRPSRPSFIDDEDGGVNSR